MVHRDAGGRRSRVGRDGMRRRRDLAGEVAQAAATAADAGGDEQTRADDAGAGAQIERRRRGRARR